MTEKEKHPRLYAEISLKALDENLGLMEERLKEKERLIAVIKANAYGHGAVRLAEHIRSRPSLWGFAVACTEEALELRAGGITEPILILGYTFPGDYERLIREEVRLTVFREDSLEELAAAARRIGKKAYVHVAVDTGMGRIGVIPDETGLGVVRALLEKEELIPEGIFSHFARADEEDKSFCGLQLQRFSGFLKEIRERLGFSFPLAHLANSAAILEYPEASFDLSRAGISMYGMYPSGQTPEKKYLSPVMSLHSHVSHVKILPEGSPVSYGGTFVTIGPTLVATIPVGYGDGYPRLLSGKGQVLIRGRRVPILGRVCMDQLMADVTELPDVKPGEPVTLLGKDGQEEITAEELGELSGRFNYELACMIAPRVPRVYLP